MAGHEEVEFALGGVRVAHQAALGPNRGQFSGSACDQFMGINLVTCVPDDPIFAEVESDVKGETQLNHTQIAGKVGRTAANDTNQLGTHFSGQLLEFLLGKGLQIRRSSDSRQDGVGHAQ